MRTAASVRGIPSTLKELLAKIQDFETYSLATDTAGSDAGRKRKSEPSKSLSPSNEPDEAGPRRPRGPYHHYGKIGHVIRDYLSRNRQQQFGQRSLKPLRFQPPRSDSGRRRDPSEVRYYGYQKIRHYRSNCPGSSSTPSAKQETPDTAGRLSTPSTQQDTSHLSTV